MLNLSWVKPLLLTGQQTLVKHAPEILMGLGTLGTGSAMIMAFKAGPKAMELVDEAEAEKAEERKKVVPYPNLIPDRVPLTGYEMIQACWKVYLPPAALFLLSMGCFWGAQGLNAKRQLVLAGLYSTAKAELKDYQTKVIELMGKDGHSEVEHAVNEEKIAQFTAGNETLNNIVTAVKAIPVDAAALAGDAKDAVVGAATDAANAATDAANNAANAATNAANSAVESGKKEAGKAIDNAAGAAKNALGI